jgi:hypothetical protein
MTTVPPPVRSPSSLVNVVSSADLPTKCATDAGSCRGTAREATSAVAVPRG